MRQLNDDYKNYEISNATLVTEDLIDSFLLFLRPLKYELGIAGKVDILQAEVDTFELEGVGYGMRYKDDETRKKAEDLLNEDLFDLMNAIAPFGCYFGAHEGDGSCFGFWESTNE